MPDSLHCLPQEIAMDVSMSPAAGYNMRLCFLRSSDGPTAMYTLAVGKWRLSDTSAYTVDSVFTVPAGSSGGVNNPEPGLCLRNVTSF